MENVNELAINIWFSLTYFLPWPSQCSGTNKPWPGSLLYLFPCLSLLSIFILEPGMSEPLCIWQELNPLTVGHFLPHRRAVTCAGRVGCDLWNSGGAWAGPKEVEGS